MASKEEKYGISIKMASEANEQKETQKAFEED
jgi:hypothetical protein